ncbi:MAG TPA: glycosyltransferase family 39 protein [Candidatus Baltobacteraceae bacterium]|nr:glycosyltransferase family 39 protein [Candidatus Baltobacteraceae bacterium]
MAQAARISLVAVRRPTLALIAAASFLLIVPLAFVLNIWQDEAYTLHTTSQGVAFAFAQSLSFEQNAPLYFVLLTLWRHVSESIFFLRLFSVLCAGLTLLMVPGIARRYVPHANAGLVMIAIAWNPFFVWAALEMRPYALIILSSSLLLVTFYDAFLAPEPKRYGALLYAVCAAAALYTQYYLAFLIAAQFIVLCVVRRGRLPAFLIGADAAAIAFAPLLTIIPGQVQNFRSPFAPPSLARSFGTLTSIVAHYVLPLPLAHPTIVYAVLAAVLAAAVAIAFILRPGAFSKSGDAMLPVTTVLAAGIFAAVTHAAHVQVLVRHGALLFVPAVLSVFAMLTFLRADLRSRAMTAWFCIAVAASFAGLAQTYGHMAKPGDWPRVVAALQEHEAPGEPIAVFEAENALPFAFYYRGPNRVVAIPAAVDFRQYDVSKFVVRSDRQLQRVMPRSKRLWLITAGECTSADLQFGCGVLERYVSTHYRVEYDASFYESRLRLLTPL